MASGGNRTASPTKPRWVRKTSEEHEGVSREWKTHQFLEAWRERTLLVRTYLDVLVREKGGGGLTHILKSKFKQSCDSGQTRTYLARVVRMLYVRVSTLRTVTILLPCGSDVWTSSCNPVKSFPSCSITVFSTLSC